MRHLPARLFGLVILLVSAGITYYKRQNVLNQGLYSQKTAIFGRWE